MTMVFVNGGGPGACQPTVASCWTDLLGFIVLRHTFIVGALWRFKRSSLSVRQTRGERGSLITALYHQSDWVRNHLGDALPVESLRFPERFN